VTPAEPKWKGTAPGKVSATKIDVPSHRSAPSAWEWLGMATGGSPEAGVARGIPARTATPKGGFPPAQSHTGVGSGGGAFERFPAQYEAPATAPTATTATPMTTAAGKPKPLATSGGVNQTMRPIARECVQARDPSRRPKRCTEFYVLNTRNRLKMTMEESFDLIAHRRVPARATGRAAEVPRTADSPVREPPSRGRRRIPKGLRRGDAP